MRRIALALLSLALCAVLLEAALWAGLIPNAKHARFELEGDPDGDRRLLILGDSFIVSWGGLAPRIAEAAAERGVAVLNLASSGTGPIEYAADMSLAAERFEPQWVLLSYYVGNDLTNVKNHPSFASDQGAKTGVAINSRRWPANSYLYQFLRERLWPMMIRHYDFDYEAAEAAGISPELIDDARELRINPWLIQIAASDPDHVLDNVMPDAEDLRAWERTEELLAGIQDLADGIGARLAIVAIPHTVQVSRSHFDFYEDLRIHLDDRTLIEDEPQRRLREFCAERGIPCLDLLPVFREHASEELYLDKDEHLNEAGDRLVARQVVRFLTDMGL